MFTFAYDALSRLTSENEKPVGGTGLLVRYTYVTGVPFLQINAPDNSSQTYNLDVFGRMRNMVYNSQGIASYTYTGILLTKRSSNGGTVSYTYDSINRPSTIFIGRGVTTPSYTYNDSSDILSDGTKSYTYDGLARVIKATPTISGATTESYTYDKTGNRIVNSVNTGSINYTTNTLDQYTLLTGSILSGSLIYDNNGNLQTDGQNTYSYDYNNRLIQINIGTGILAKYTYDVLGRRTQKIDYSKSATNPEVTIYVYNGDNIISEYRTIGVLVGGSGSLIPLTLKKNYINSIGTDALLAYEAEEQISPTSTGKVTNRYYYHLNQLGSVIALSSSTGAVLIKYSYDSFGLPKVLSGSTLIDFRNYTGNKYSNVRLFTGREHDRETGYYYMRARYYNAENSGRFINRDPIGQNDQVNLYTYVANSPLMYTDRMGLSAKALIQLFRDAQSDMEKFRLGHQVSGYSNDWNIEINSFYFNKQFAGNLIFGIRGEGTYDLAYGRSGIKKKYGIKDSSGNDTGNVLFAGQVVSLGEISNVLTALNANRLGLSQDHLEYWAMRTVELGAGNGEKGELADRKLYTYGYALGTLENINGSLTDEQIINGIKNAVQSRQNYLQANH